MRSPVFWDYFEKEAAPKLSIRWRTFRLIFEHLDRIERPVGIVETGCVRQPDNWAGDGQSTLLFDRYTQAKPGSAVYTCDIDKSATATCKSLVSAAVKVITSDSVAFLAGLVRERPADLPAIDLLYLDSVDVDLTAPLPSAIHHLKELLAISPMISPQTLVVVDDSPSLLLGYADGTQFKAFNRPPMIGGKGQLIAEYANAIGVKPVFAEYQCGWTGLGR